MTEDEAQEIVYGFIDVVSEGAAIVCDADRLQHPKETIARAFKIHIEGYETLRAISAETFREMGYDKQVENLKSMWVRLDDFKQIIPEDKPAVAALITGKMPSEDTIQVLAKYLTN